MVRLPAGFHFPAQSGPSTGVAARRINPVAMPSYQTRLVSLPLQVTGTITASSSQFPVPPFPLVGAFLDLTPMGAASWSSALSQWTTLLGLPTVPVTRYYLAESVYTYDTNMQEMVAAGVKICLDIRPAYNPPNATDLASMTTLLQTLKAAGARCDICLWHEPYFEGLTIAQFQAMIAYYGPVVRQFYPLFFVTSVQSVENDSENSYFISGAFDGCASDFYNFDYTTDGYTLTLAATPANTAGLPFGLWEMNSSTDPVKGYTQAQASAYFTYIEQFFTARNTAGQANADLIFFNSGGYNLLGTPATGQNTGFEGGTGVWNPTNCTITDTSAEAHTGFDSCELDSSAAGNMSIRWPSGTSGVAVTAGTTYTCAGWFLWDGTARTCQPGIDWYTSAGGANGSNFGGGITDSGTWQQTAEAVAAPALSAFAEPILQVESTGAAGEIHYADDAIFAAASNTATVMGFNFGSAVSADFRIPLYEALATAVDALPNPVVEVSAQVSLGPTAAGETWYPVAGTVATSAGVSDDSTAGVYLNIVSQQGLLNGQLYQGGGDSFGLAISSLVPGERIIVEWAGVASGEVCTFSLAGSRSVLNVG
jgi:hypothetical protein